MADEITVKVTGTEKVSANLKRWQVVKKKAIEDVTKETGLRIEADAKREITRRRAVDTGRLRASISTNWTGSGSPFGKTGSQATESDGVGQPSAEKGFTAAVGTNVFYGPYIEFGTYKMRARRFLWPAYIANQGQYITRIKQILGKDEFIR